jgi:hypothetical protein
METLWQCRRRADVEYISLLIPTHGSAPAASPALQKWQQFVAGYFKLHSPNVEKIAPLYYGMTPNYNDPKKLASELLKLSGLPRARQREISLEAIKGGSPVLEEVGDILLDAALAEAQMGVRHMKAGFVRVPPELVVTANPHHDLMTDLKDEVEEWCRANLLGRWRLHKYLFGADETNDIILFKLRWL